MANWYNFGDVNFLEHGGTMVRRAYDDDHIKKYPSFRDEFQAFCLHRIPEDEHKVFVYLKNICLSDWDDEKEKIIEFEGVEPSNDYDWARAIAEYIGNEPSLDEAYNGHMYPQAEDYIITETEAKEWLEKEVFPYIEPPHKVCPHCGARFYINEGMWFCPRCRKGLI